MREWDLLLMLVVWFVFVLVEGGLYKRWLIEDEWDGMLWLMFFFVNRDVICGLSELGIFLGLSILGENEVRLLIS